MRAAISLLAMILAAAAVPASAAGASGCDRYASVRGDDGAAGSSAAPVRTPQRLADLLEPGQTGCLRRGTYTGSGPVGYVLYLERGGRKGAPITLRSAPGSRAKLFGTVIVARGANHVRFKQLDFDARRPFDALNGRVGISIFAKHTQLTRNRITSSRARSCVLLGSNGYEGAATRTVIRSNRFERCGNPANGQLDHGIYAAETRRALIADNVFVGTAAYAVHLYPNAQRSVVRDNVLLDNGGGIIVAGDYQYSSSRNLITRNLIVSSHSKPEVVGWFPSRAGRGNVVRANCLAPGLYAYSEDNRGLRLSDNRITTADDCLQGASQGILARVADTSATALSQLTAAVPALAPLIPGARGRR